MPSSSRHLIFLGMYILCERDLQGVLILTNVGVSDKVLSLNSHRPSGPCYRAFKQKIKSKSSAEQAEMSEQSLCF